MGLQARLMSQALRKLTGNIARTNCAVVFLNQIRHKIGVMFGSPETTCIHPDTRVMVVKDWKHAKSLTMSHLFEQLGYNWETMPIDEMIEVSEKQIKVLSYDTDIKANIPVVVEAIIRKPDQKEFALIDIHGNVVLSAAGTHLVYDAANDTYVTLESIGNDNTIKSFAMDGNTCDYQVIETRNTIPVIDIQVENGCYYTNGILSHNTGGNALKFYASVRMDVRRIETLKEGDESVANKTRVKIVKNKVVPPFKKAEFDIVFGEGIDWVGSMVDLMTENGLIKKSGTWYSIGEERIGQGRANVIKYFKENRALADKCLEDLKAVLYDKDNKG